MQDDRCIALQGVRPQSDFRRMLRQQVGTDWLNAQSKLSSVSVQDQTYG